MRYKDRNIESVVQMLGTLKSQVKSKHLVWFRGQAPGAHRVYVWAF